MTDPIEASDRPRMKRALHVAIIGVAIEVLLLIVGMLSPAMGPLLRPMYLVVAVIFLVAVWQAARPRTGRDRRQTDRRGDVSGSDGQSLDR